MKNYNFSQTGLLLSGGGARGAYQAGCLKAVGQIIPNNNPFPIITGISAGAINASYIASHADTFQSSTDSLLNLWSSLSLDQVIDTSFFSTAKTAFDWSFDLGFGGILSKSKIKSLVNTHPLRKLLSSNIISSSINKNIEKQHLEAIALTATDYSNNQNVTFMESKNKNISWQRANRFSVETKIDIDHILASSAIPLLFSPIKIKNSYFGDGTLRNTAPLSPTIKLGAKKIMIIGVRGVDQNTKPSGILPTTARVLSVLLNSALLDSIDMDIERLERINLLLSNNPNSSFEKLEKIQYLYLRPSEDLAKIAQEYFSELPGLLKYLIRGLGTKEEASELLSYILFEKKYCEIIGELGFKDTLKREKEVIEFFSLKPS